jgi:hypothetical protein
MIEKKKRESFQKDMTNRESRKIDCYDKRNLIVH